MKSLKIALLTIVGIMVFAFTYTSYDRKTYKYIVRKTHWQYILNNQYMFSGEVSNLDYREFLNALKQEGKLDVFDKYNIDSTAWLTIYGNYGIGLSRDYHTLPKYDDFPVVNITHEAAEAYCEWLTELYNSGNHGYKHMFKKVKVRLPKKEEWLKAAKSLDSTRIYTWTGNGCVNRKGRHLANYRAFDKEFKIEGDSMLYKNSGALGGIEDVILLTVPVESYFPNEFGLYNMCGNVAEMLDETGVTIGGCYLTDERYMRLDSELDCSPGWTYGRPFIGFRPIMDVIEE